MQRDTWATMLVHNYRDKEGLNYILYFTSFLLCKLKKITNFMK